MVLAPESTNAVKPSNDHTTLRGRPTVPVGKLATTIPSLPTLRGCAATGGASLLARSWNREACDARHLIPSSIVQDAPVLRLLRPAPLLEEERDTSTPTLIKDLADPVGVHGSRTLATLRANDDALDIVVAKLSQCSIS